MVVIVSDLKSGWLDSNQLLGNTYAVLFPLSSSPQ
jgi:hypothetical protein